MLELGLRVFGYGPNLSLFRQENIWGRPYLQMNPDIKFRYFGTTDFQPSTDPEFFQLPKPQGEYRIFTLGESTTAGYPYWYNGAFPAYLRTRLNAVFPGRRIEVINLGMTATNSYTALDIVTELGKYQPDLIIYYGGHNEFYGALGVASNLSVGSYRFVTEIYLKLVHLRTFQLLRNTIQWVGNLFGKSAGPISRGTEMEKVARGHLVPYDSPLYQSAYSIFRENLKGIRKYCRARGIPLIMGTQVSDMRDQPPFVSRNPAGITGDAKTEFQKLFEDGERSQADGKWDSAEADYRLAIKLDSLYADAHYRLAQCLDTAGHKSEALQQYTMARNYDQLRFRTDSNFNNLIRSMDDGKTCFVTDVEKTFESLSPDSLIGHNLILEHLHPNSNGAFAIAKCYAAVMHDNGLFESRAGWDRADTIGDRELWNKRLVTDIDEHMANLSVDWLISGWPFRNQAPALKAVSRLDTLDWIAEEAVAGKVSWSAAHILAADFYKNRGNWDEVAAIYRSLLSEAQLDISLRTDVEEAYQRANQLREAAKVLLPSIEIYPTLQAYRSLGDIMMRLANPDSAVKFYEKMDDFAQTREERLRNGMVISYAYAKAGQYENAKRRLLAMLAEAPDYQAAKKLLDDVRALESSSSTSTK